MNIDQAVDIVWDAREAGRPPERLRGALTMAEAYAVQDAVLARHLAAGEQLAGWKIGGNSPAGRANFGTDSPFSGFLLARGALPSGQPVPFDVLPGPGVLEAEITVTLGKSLTGADLTRTMVLEAISAVHASYEIPISRLGEPLDLPQLVADNAAQWAYVLGDPIAVGAPDDLATLRVESERDGAGFDSAIVTERMDNPIDSILALARNLYRRGHAMVAGQHILTGACVAPAQLVAGDRWHTRFGENAAVSVSFA